MLVNYLASYDGSFHKLQINAQHSTIEAIDRLLDYFQTGQRPHGLRLQRLPKGYWEIRVGLRIRVLFELSKERLTFVIVGDHDAMRQWLNAN